MQLCIEPSLSRWWWRLRRCSHLVRWGRGHATEVVANNLCKTNLARVTHYSGDICLGVCSTVGLTDFSKVLIPVSLCWGCMSHANTWYSRTTWSETNLVGVTRDTTQSPGSHAKILCLELGHHGCMQRWSVGKYIKKFIVVNCIKIRKNFTKSRERKIERGNRK